jgi:hypothetical protein
MAFLGSFGKFLGKGLKGVSKAAGFIPGIGNVAGGVMGGLGELLEKGSKTKLGGLIGSTAGGLSGALGGLLGLGGGAAGGGGKLGTLAKMLGVGAAGASLYGGYKQSKKDSKYARALADEALENYRGARQMAQDRWASQSPLRDAFNFGAFNMADPTNPFSRGNMFQQPQPTIGTAGNLHRTDPGNQLGGLLGFTGGTGIGTEGNLRRTDPGTQLGGLLSLRQGGGRAPGEPTLRSRSVKGANVSGSQDRGRDREDDDEERKRF